MNQPVSPRPGRFPAKIATAALALAIGLIAGELLVRGSGSGPDVKAMGLDMPGSVYVRSSNPILGYELRPNHRDPQADSARSYAYTNAHGQRDVERSLDKPGGVRRVILLGDSVVEGHDLPSLEDTISRRMERLAADTEVLNFGVSGYCTLAEVELLAVKGVRFDPDQVVLLFVANDFDNFNREAFRLGHDFERPAIVESLFRHSHAFRLLAVRRNLFDYGAEVDPVGWNDRAVGDNNVVEGLERLQRLAASHDFEPRVAIWPTFADDGVRDVHFMPEAEDELIIEHLASARGIPAFRLSTAFRADRQTRDPTASPRRLYTVGDGLHPSRLGAEIAAQALHRALLEPPSAPPARRAQASASDLARDLGQARPDYSRVHNNLGLELKAAGELEQAVERFRMALEIDPELADAHNNLGNVLRELGRIAEAQTHYREAIRLDPLAADVRFNLALTLDAGNEPEAAVAQLRETLRIQPDHADAHHRLGDLLGNSGAVEEAMVHYRAALASKPESPALHANLGALLASRGRWEEAEALLRRAIELKPDHELARRHLSRVVAMQEARREDG